MHNTPSDHTQDQTAFTPLVPATPDALDAGKPASSVPPSPLFYTQEQDDDPDLHLPPLDVQSHQPEQDFPFVFPFQHSAALPTIADPPAPNPSGPPSPGAMLARNTRLASLRLLKWGLIASVVLITVIGASLFVFAQPAASPASTPANTLRPTQASQTPPVIATKPTPPTVAPTPPPPSLPQATTTPSPQEQSGLGSGSSSLLTIPSASLLHQLGWTQAGLSTADALEALRTGTTFTDREMSYDYRNIGTVNRHSGTLTAATFLLTSGGQVRFAHNDVRVINNMLYNRISTHQLIQQVVNAHPSLVQLQVVPVQGHLQTFAWVTVTFALFQSQVDPTSGTRSDGLVLDAATGQPLLHHLAVVLVRQPLQTQRPDAPMGGTGWLVDTYALDANTLPTIATNPFL